MVLTAGGEAKCFIQDGALELGGRLPNSIHGGLLFDAYIHGLNTIAEGVRLLRATLRKQPQKAAHVLVSSGVGVPAGAMILGAIRFYSDFESAVLPCFLVVHAWPLV